LSTNRKSEKFENKTNEKDLSKIGRVVYILESFFQSFHLKTPETQKINLIIRWKEEPIEESPLLLGPGSEADHRVGAESPLRVPDRLRVIDALLVVRYEA